MHKRSIIGLKLDEIEDIVSGYGYNLVLAKSICIWVYRRSIRSFLEMDGIPMALRMKFDADFEISTLSPISAKTSTDGTIKYLFETQKKNPFETAFMPSEKRNTLCVSTQSGCRIGCSFCYTGKLGLKENLTDALILKQLIDIPQRPLVNRLVLMGMGEPLDNPEEVFRALEILNAQWGIAFGAANITLSTVGILPLLGRLVDSRLCNIAISLHSPIASQRAEIIPTEKEFPILSIVDFFRKNPVRKPIRLSFEYVVVPNENDSELHVNSTAKLLSGMDCHVNVIPLNTANRNFDNERLARNFQLMLNDLGQPATFRVSYGQDISAACGMMAGKI